MSVQTVKERVVRGPGFQRTSALTTNYEMLHMAYSRSKAMVKALWLLQADSVPPCATEVAGTWTPRYGDWQPFLYSMQGTPCPKVLNPGAP